MQHSYPVKPSVNDPEITFPIRSDILCDLQQRAAENGHSLKVEMMIRLARTLEEDQHRDEFDRNFAKTFFLDQ